MLDALDFGRYRMASLGRPLAFTVLAGGIMLAWQIADSLTRPQPLQHPEQRAAAGDDRARGEHVRAGLASASREPLATALASALQSQAAPAPPPGVEQPRRSVVADIEPERPCATDVRIAGLFHDPHEPERSLVVLRGGEFGPGGAAVGLGMRVGDRRLVNIYPHTVRLEAHGTACWLGMFNPLSRAKLARERSPSQGNARRAPTRATAALGASELKAGIQRIDALNYRIDRALADKALERGCRLAASVRARPLREGRRVVGMRLERIPGSGFASKLGLRKGDVLRAVNGVAVGDQGAFAAASASVRRANRVTVTLERDRRLLQLSYVLE